MEIGIAVVLGTALAWIMTHCDLTREEKLHREEDADEEECKEL